MEYAEALRGLGLSSKEISVYCASLSLGQSSASAIARKAGIQRELTYAILRRLMQKGIVSMTIKSSRQQYEAAAPRDLVSKVEESRLLLVQAVPELEKLRNSPHVAKPAVKVYEGAEGIKTIFNYMLRIFGSSKERVLYGYGSAGKFEQILPWTIPHLIDARVQQGIRFKAIYNRDRAGARKSALPLSEVRFIAPQLESSTFVFLFPGHVAMVIFSEEPVGVIFESAEIHKSYLMYFQLLWKDAKQN